MIKRWGKRAFIVYIKILLEITHWENKSNGKLKQNKDKQNLYFNINYVKWQIIIW